MATTKLPPFLDTTPPPVPPPSPERLAALYSFTRAQRESNPDGYAANVKWWGDVLAASLRSGYLGDDVLVFDGVSLPDKLANGSQRPRGLGGVIDTLTSSSTLLPAAKYESATEPLDASPSIASRLVGAGWSVLGRLSPFGESTEDQLWKHASRMTYVHVANVRAAAAAWIAHVAANPPLEYTDGVFSRASFARAFSEPAAPGEQALSERDMDVLVTWLARDARRIVVDGDIIKMGAGPISEADRGAVAVADALNAVERQVVSAEAEAQRCADKAREKIKAGQRSSAAAYLRSKRQLDELVGKRIAAGEQLRSVHRALNQAKGDAEIMSAYEASTAALAQALSDPRLSPDRIAATTDALADALADQREIDDAIRLGSQLATGPVVDEDDELAKELEAMVIDEKARLEAEAEARAKAEAEAKVRAEAEAKEKEREKAEAERAEKEKEAKEARIRAEVEARVRAEMAREKKQAEPRRTEAEVAAADWARRYDDAQEREAAERARFEAERLAREERRVPAE